MAVGRRTKIVATLGPASAQPATIDALIAAGVDVFRLNFSHGTHDAHAATVKAVRASAVRASRHVSILQDLSGPKIRTGSLAGGRAIELHDGAVLRIAVGDAPGEPGRISTTYAPLIDSARPGARLLLDDGRIELRVTGKTNGELITAVVNGGSLGEHKGINAPGVALPADSPTAKDEQDLRFGLALGVDFVALSFVQTPGDIVAARRILGEVHADVPLIAKIERPQALESLDAILEAADGVMVARGDLGLECPLEQVPRIQRSIVARARVLGRPVIVATQVFESMCTEPRPTRAEVSDAATAVDEGVDAIMLAGETAIGQFPVQSVQMLATVICAAEGVPARGESLAADVGLDLSRASGRPPGADPVRAMHGRAMCDAAVTLASNGQAEVIVALTHYGKTARLLSLLRPPATIIAVTPSDVVARRLMLFRGVRPIVSDRFDLAGLTSAIRAEIDLAPDAAVVYINISPDLTNPNANFLNVQQLAI